MDRQRLDEMGNLAFAVLVAFLAGIFVTACMRSVRGEEPAKPALVVFGATWCPHCQALKAELPRYSTKYDVRYVDVEREPATAAKWGVTVSAGIPVTVFARPAGGKFRDVARLRGYSSRERFSQWLEQSERLR